MEKDIKHIAIITLPLHSNYGGILQAYALQTVLEKITGGRADLIIIQPKSRKAQEVGFMLHHLSFVINQLEHPVQFIRRVYRYLTAAENDIQQQTKHTSNFIEEHIHRLPFSSWDEIPVEDFDAIVVGSDQVWRDAYWESMTKKKIDYAFLSFTKDKKVLRIAYAASFGLDSWQWDDKTTERLIPLIKSFNAISVREDTGVTLLNDYANTTAQCVLDPTLLLDKDKYVSLIGERPHHPHCCMSYVLDMDDSKGRLIKSISQQLSLEVYQANNPKAWDNDAPAEERVQPPLEDWLQGFNDADFVVTDSYHACALSIIFNVPFVAIGNAGRGLTRFQSLLHATGQDYRLVTDLGAFQLTEQILRKPDCNLSQLRRDSLEFLCQNIIKE